MKTCLIVSCSLLDQLWCLLRILFQICRPLRRPSGRPFQNPPYQLHYLRGTDFHFSFIIKRPSPNPIETRYFFTTLCFDKIQSATFFRSTEVCTFVRVHTHSLLNYMQMMHSFMIQDTVSCLFLHFLFNL